MRLNKFIALSTGISRRAADDVIAKGNVQVNGAAAELGQHVEPGTDNVILDGKALDAPESPQTIMLNKPAGYVCSRDGQGSKTIYDLLPHELHRLKPVGRLDKDSSGLLLLTNDGKLAFELTHPSFQKEKVYEIELDKPLTDEDKVKISAGVMLDDGVSKLKIEDMRPAGYKVTMSEGRNRQIRRTFEALGHKVTSLHRTHFGPFTLGKLDSGIFKPL